MAAGLRDGVHLSRDGGATWKLVSPADNIELQPVVSVAFRSEARRHDLRGNASASLEND